MTGNLPDSQPRMEIHSVTRKEFTWTVNISNSISRITSHPIDNFHPIDSTTLRLIIKMTLVSNTASSGRRPSLEPSNLIPKEMRLQEDLTEFKTIFHLYKRNLSFKTESTALLYRIWRFKSWIRGQSSAAMKLNSLQDSVVLLCFNWLRSTRSSCT